LLDQAEAEARRGGGKGKKKGEAGCFEGKEGKDPILPLEKKEVNAQLD